jgi:hypothetical protein
VCVRDGQDPPHFGRKIRPYKDGSVSGSRGVLCVVCGILLLCVGVGGSIERMCVLLCVEGWDWLERLLGRVAGVIGLLEHVIGVGRFRR